MSPMQPSSTHLRFSDVFSGWRDGWCIGNEWVKGEILKVFFVQRFKFKKLQSYTKNATRIHATDALRNWSQSLFSIS